MSDAREQPFYLGHRPQLDGLRGIAIILVLLHHAGVPYVHGGHIGVDIFFVLSGFLITVLLYQEYTRFESINLKRFYIRRLLRLTPALLGLLILFAGFTLATKSGDALANTGQSILLTALYLSDFAIAFNYSTLGGLGHTWSLAIEEHFYLIYPISLLFLLRKGSSTRSGFIVLTILIVFIAFYRMFMWGPAPEEVARVYYGFDTRADGLLVGSLLGLTIATGRLPKVSWHCALFGTAILMLALMFADWDSRLYAYGLPLINISAALVLAYVIMTDVKWLANRALVWVGIISYGLYLWHNLIFILIRERITESPWAILLLGSIVSIFVAGLSYYVLEKPCLKLKKRFAPSDVVKGHQADTVLTAPAH
jgi:peptidoglycan/LPS O-acetylase OafA/YrhL